MVTRAAAVQQQAVKPEGDVPGMTAYLDSLRWNKDGLVAVIAQVNSCTMKYSTWLATLQLHTDAASAASHLLYTPPLRLQHVDTGEVLMQAYADRNAICETLQTG